MIFNLICSRQSLIWTLREYSLLTCTMILLGRSRDFVKSLNFLCHSVDTERCSRVAKLHLPLGRRREQASFTAITWLR